ncbi:MAG: phosphoribosylamine--glycine ligase [Sphaerochaetaceae bacterium]|jgi:phosphoribosylamine--glycine ligase|nr:phosphoribosylamine--glycine ligase [Sphaerochaetaceae bacterium]MDD4219030.1 phosphoribosylamine--glycine ligase [Sphaerochaetaceae bacterium]MDY0371029.1 phosphoribosylamine--glycine ligase [Sphaerochaetaceae bacterium]
MRVLVLGSGAKDHAMTWLFSQSKLIDGLFVAQGNVGTASIAENLPEVNPSSPESVYAACLEHNINFVFIGTEAPLFTGVIDYLNNKGIDTFGAPGNALKLEGDRYFARTFTARHNIPTPPYKLFSDEDSLSNYLKRHPGKNFVLKRNAMAPSRIMINSNDYDALMSFGKGILQTDNLLLENHLSGLTITSTVFTDNNGYLMLPLCSEYTKSETGAAGAPTGGMGSICPVPLPKNLQQKIIDLIIEPTLYGMQVEQFAYKGVLTFSIIIYNDSPVLVDYHVRFNDPATQAIVPLIKSDIVEILHAMKHDTVKDFSLKVSNKSAVAVVVASQGYPDKPLIGQVVEPIPTIIRNNIFSTKPMVFYGAVMEKEGQAVTTGGRNVTIVGTGNNIIQANKQVYQYIDTVKFNGAWYRHDIGNKFFED